MSGEPELQQGQSGEWVQYLQQALQYAGYYSGEASGEFGAELEQAVAQFQTAYGLTADGVVRADTWAVLTGESAGSQSSDGQSSGQQDPSEQVLDIDWAAEFPELYTLATVSGFEDYVRNVVGVDPAELQTEADEPVA